jgi:pyridoxal phosphate enzyme (YggS family)
MSDVAQRLAHVRERIAHAERTRGPGPTVTLCAVSKRHPVAAITAAAACGQLDFGENYAQELHAKRTELADHPQLRWHAIGPLQRNKVKAVIGCALIHTVDRPELLTALQTRASAAGVAQRVLVQVNVAGESSKSGVTPEGLPALLDAFAGTPAVECVGLMTIPPAATPEEARPHFVALRRLLEREAATSRAHVALRELSMGMSGDFEIAIVEGATVVRVGTAIFGPRPA